MARKARKGRGILITLCVIVGLFIVAVVAVRLFLTRDKLLAIVIPRVETTLDAKVSIGDIGINFPFGLGVDITALSFEKTLPDTSALAFTSEKVTVRSSLMSLLRRKPEIKAADVQGGAVTLTNEKKGREIKIRGLGTQISMQPAAELFALSVKALADSVLVSAIGAPPAVTLEKVGFDGELESDPGLTRIVVKKSKLSWGDLVTATIEGEVTNPKTEPRVALTVEAADKPLGPVLEKIRTFRLAELSPAKAQAAGPRQAQTPVEITGGAFGFNARIEGLAKQPLAMNVSFDGHLTDAAVKSGDLASIGAMNVEVKGEGVALAWAGLFPGLEKPVTPAEIGMAWQAIKLDATVEIERGEFVLQSKSAPAGAAATAAPGAATPASGSAPSAGASPQPVRVSSTKARVELSGPDVKKLSGEFFIGSSPYRFEGSMINVMPAAAELALVGKRLMAAGQKQIPDPGTLLDGLANAPVVTFEVSGRAFDAQPYQKPLFGSSGGGASPAPTAQPPAQASAQAPSSAPAAALLFLKNTTFTAKLDSVITREAVFTELEGKGTIRDGRIKIEPATFKYAGGKGAANVNVDARRTARVETKLDLSIDGIEASQALGRITSKAEIVQGKFSFKSNGTVATGPGINPITALSAAGSALSSKGAVSIGGFLEPLAKIPGFDITPFREFSFKEWTGNFVVRDGRCATDDWKVASSRGDWTVKGSFGFDGTLDYAVHVVLPPSVQAQMKDIDRYKAAFDLMRDKSGNLVLDIHIGGSAKHPSATLDLTKAKSKAQERALEGLRKLLK
jgi:hypothetical protein